jgi:hypothetical protein
MLGRLLGRDAARRKEARAEPYASSGARSEEDQLASLSGRLMQDLVVAIRGLAVSPVFSARWVEQSRTLARLATVVVAEEVLDDSAGATVESKSPATLWESEEAAKRAILEQGKGNTLIRMLDEYKSSQRALSLVGDAGDRASDHRNQEAAAQFERSICTILRCLLRHDEVVQTIELGLLCATVRDCLHFCVTRPESLSEQVQRGCLEAACFAILDPVLRQAEEMGEERALVHVKRCELLGLFVMHLRLNGERLGEEDRLAGLRAVSVIVGLEAYAVDDAQFLRSEHERAALVSLEALASTFSDIKVKSELRPLLIEVRRLRRRDSSAHK